MPPQPAAGLAVSRQNLLSKLDRFRKRQHTLLVLVVDCTETMGRYIKEIENQIHTIVDGIRSVESRQELHFVFVGYRDVKANAPIQCFPPPQGEGAQRIYAPGVVTDTFQAEYASFMSGLPAKDGDDIPEDIFTAYDYANRYMEHSQCGTKVLFHVTEAPCHGRKYHDFRRDNYPDYDQTHPPELFLRKFAQMNVDFYFGSLHRRTDKMVQIFKEAYLQQGNQNFKARRIEENPYALTREIIHAVTGSVNRAWQSIEQDAVRLRALFDAATLAAPRMAVVRRILLIAEPSAVPAADEGKEEALIQQALERAFDP
eukprot:m.235487 g.235487  ORF g.235487 m.235487 type:complete len:314 (-) comp15260_c0_seq1:228-1169(-)